MNRQKILIVDDSEMNREMLKAILGEGYKYAEAVDGAQALRMLQQDMNIDLVLLDINMPKIDGFAVLEHMNQFHWIDEVPVIMISAADDRESIKRCYSLGVADYIRRPFDSYIVQRRVQNTLRLYANQKRLMGMVSDQIYRNQRDSNVMIGILSHIVEFRNSESAQHVLQVQTVTGMLLRRLVEKTDVYHLTEEKIRLIVTASALHDIGKISIPENILIRYGGDEFLLLFPRMTEEIFLEKKKQIQQAVRGIRMSEFADIQLSVSVGGVCGVHPITEAIRKADYLMYLDKAEQQP